MRPDYVIFCDGGGTANPGKIGVAAVVCAGWTPEVIAESAVHAGEGTNNVAEYRALRHAIQMANLGGARRPVFLTDSKLVVQQVNGWWAMRGNGSLQALHGHCTSELMKFDSWLLKHVAREHNKRADWLVCNLLGHGRTLKNKPAVTQVSVSEDAGRPGWAELTQ